MFEINLDFQDSDSAKQVFEDLMDFIGDTLHMCNGGICSGSQIRAWCSENTPKNPDDPTSCGAPDCDHKFEPCTPEIRQRVVDWCTERTPLKMFISDIVPNDDEEKDEGEKDEGEKDEV